MHPAFSVIFFTVSSGAGFGLFALLVLADIVRLGNGLSPLQLVIGGAIALVLISAGLMSSVFHLANPKNAWRAFSRFRTSWLSREGVFAMAFYPFALVYLGAAWFLPHMGWLRFTFGTVAVLLAWVTIFSTGMIYACLKTIRQWHTPLVPANYVALAHFSGALLLLIIAYIGGTRTEPFQAIALAFLCVAGLLKAIYYFWMTYPGVASTINTATGFTRAQVRLLDAGHTHGTFLTEEFGFQLARRHALLLKAVVFGAAFGLPLATLVLWYGQSSLLLFAAIALIAIAGIVVERWLFFAEARHVVNLYHGAQRC